MKNYFVPAFLLLTTASFAQRVNQDSLVNESKKTEVWQPVPKPVTPGATASEAPSDAIVLFNGTNLDSWVKESDNKAPGWKLDGDGAMTVVKGSGNLKTKQAFGNCQLHIEWREPSAIAGSSQSRGNSGIFFMGKYELQVLDSYNNPTYVNGQAGSIYKQHIPLVNASRKPGEWQSYDVIFTAPSFDAAGKVLSPARITVLHNGVLVQNNVAIKGSTQWIGQPSYEKHGDKEPIVLQDHGKDGGNPMSYRNIWVRELN
ncbi:3-keto-disaccharide hydrolase [Sediminibacterium soli]|uniref:3-keto-disaccharide hydrolase n=1 Tax=Sediminibacterium soli TaxID=2698829 RepID=UPI00137B2EED|nr:DUF1080 domain-containing protein [Sediminibacterium soli]NCI48257.1 DUF1080 domain-containing protein [Sediminibacterium soli]